MKKNLEELHKESAKQIKDFTIGADPEFLVLDDRSRLVESKIHDYSFANFGNLGHDGSGINRIFEARPSPSFNPLVVTKNIHGILFEKFKLTPHFHKYRFKAGSFHRPSETPMGGHIHMGGPHCLSTAMNYDDVTEVLDNYVGAISVILEDADEGLRRRRYNDSHYGFAGDFRTQPFGAEYRVCGSWLVSPHITNAFLCLFKIVVFEYINNKSFPFRRHDCESDFYYMNVSNILKRFGALWNDIQAMKLYPEYKPYVDVLYNLINKKLSWFPKVGLKEAWGIFPVRLERPKPMPKIKYWAMLDLNVPQNAQPEQPEILNFNNDEEAF